MGVNVYLIAMWLVILHGHQTTLISWTYGKILKQTQNFTKNFILEITSISLILI